GRRPARGAAALRQPRDLVGGRFRCGRADGRHDAALAHRGRPASAAGAPARRDRQLAHPAAVRGQPMTPGGSCTSCTTRTFRGLTCTSCTTRTGALLVALLLLAAPAEARRRHRRPVPKGAPPARVE